MSARDPAGTIVVGWAEIYTRGLPRAAATARIAELASDVHEQRVDAESAGVGHLATTFLIIRRTVLGAGADVGWRRAQLAAQAGAAATPDGRGIAMATTRHGITRLKRRLVTRRCVACGERYARRLPYCPVCKTLPGHDGIPKDGGYGGGIGMHSGGGL